VRPQPDAVRPFAPEHDRDSRSHAPAPMMAISLMRASIPNRFSLPVSRRRIFAECLMTISTEAIAINTQATGALPYSCNTSAKLGKAATAAIDPKET